MERYIEISQVGYMKLSKLYDIFGLFRAITLQKSKHLLCTEHKYTSTRTDSYSIAKHPI